MELLDVFRKNYLVYGLGDDMIQEVAEFATVEIKTAGEDLIRFGERSGDLFVILDGRVNILSQGGDKLAEVGPGAVIGEIALIDDQPRSANATCVGLVKAARIPAKELRTYMNTNRQVGFTMLANLARVLCFRLRQTDQKLDALMDKVTDPWQNAL